MPDVKKYLDNTGVSELWERIKNKFVAKEFKTGSQSVYKVLSDNNLTDALVDKINNAGDSDFSGSYDDLTNRPSIEGHDLLPGENSAASLGLATPNDIATATNDMATKTWVEGKGYATTSNVNTLISAAVSTVYTPKGSIQTLEELNTKVNTGKVGDVWNMSAEFTTDAGFVEGPGKKYPAGTNVVLVDVSGLKKWDVLAGSVDLSGYLEAADLVAITETELDEICV